MPNIPLASGLDPVVSDQAWPASGCYQQEYFSPETRIFLIKRLDVKYLDELTEPMKFIRYKTGQVYANDGASPTSGPTPTHFGG